MLVLVGGPDRATVREHVSGPDQVVLDAFNYEDVEREGRPVLLRGQAIVALIEREELRQETLACTWRRLPMWRKR